MAMIDRRGLLLAGVAAATVPAAIARAAGIDAAVKTGTLMDVQHVVVLMQENRSFDHYFGAMNGVRGFADRFPIPLEGGPTVWTQGGRKGDVAPFPLDTTASPGLMRVEGTPHTWPDSQEAWDHGRMGRWAAAKTDHSMGYYRGGDIPFQYALADAFTVCDAYHCSMQTGTNTNRLFLWTGTNDSGGAAGGPAIGNSHDTFPVPKPPPPYTWTTYVERLQGAGISWRIYQDMADNFSDNPLVGFKAFRDAMMKAPGADAVLAERGLSTRKLDGLKADVLAGKLPQVSYVVAPAAASEHPMPSSPAQGADYTAQVIEALTADPKVWARTVLLVMFDENDGFFDHMPPPAPPSRDPEAPETLLGGSTVDTAGEYHLRPSPDDKMDERPALIGRPYGLGPRVPMYVISPWSRGGFVNSQVFDHTSVIRFLEARFGVREPNISPWRRTVCGDLTSCFDFRTPNAAPFAKRLPATAEPAAKAAALKVRTTPAKPPAPLTPVQAAGPRPSRALPYALEVVAKASDKVMALLFGNSGPAGAVFHVYDRHRLGQPPRRYTVEAGKTLTAELPLDGAYDLWILGPNGFHRHAAGTGGAEPEVSAVLNFERPVIRLNFLSRLAPTRTLSVTPLAYVDRHRAWTGKVIHGAPASRAWRLEKTGGWYDLEVTCRELPRFRRRFAGRLETLRDSITDPAMGGPAVMTWVD